MDLINTEDREKQNELGSIAYRRKDFPTTITQPAAEVRGDGREG